MKTSILDDSQASRGCRNSLSRKSLGRYHALLNLSLPFLNQNHLHSDVCSDELYAFHTSTSSWEFLHVRGDAPSARGGASLNAVRSSLVLFGGESYEGTFNEVYKFGRRTRECCAVAHYEVQSLHFLDTMWRKWYIGVGPENFRPGKECCAVTLCSIIEIEQLQNPAVAMQQHRMARRYTSSGVTMRCAVRLCVISDSSFCTLFLLGWTFS